MEHVILGVDVGLPGDPRTGCVAQPALQDRLIEAAFGLPGRVGFAERMKRDAQLDAVALDPRVFHGARQTFPEIIAHSAGSVRKDVVGFPG